MTGAPQPIRTVLWRGLRKRCPRCGRGPLFQRWMTLRPECTFCRLEFDPTPGSTWGFWVIGDRIFVIAALLPIYFGLALESPLARGLLLAAIAVPLIATMPNRQGLATALDFLTSEPPEGRS